MGEWRAQWPRTFPDFHVCDNGELEILTLEDGGDRRAKHVASVGDWIIRGVQGEFYACKPDIFALTYENAELQSGAPAPQNSVEQEMQDRGWELASFDEIAAELERLMNAAKFYAARLSMLGYNPDSPEPAVGEGI